MLNEIQDVGIGQVLRRRLGVLASGSPAPAIAPEFMPTLCVENDRPEWHYLANSKLAGATANVAAVVGQLSFVAVTNPAGSNGLVVVEHALIVTPAGSSIQLLTTLSSFAGTPITPTVRDTRWIVAPQTTAGCFAQVTAGNVAGGPPDARFAVFESTTTTEWDQPVILRPGSSFCVIHATNNVAITRVSVQWRERALVPGELG